MWRVDSLERTLMLGNEGKMRRGQQRMRCLDSIINSMDMNLRNLQETVKDREAWRAAVQSWRWLSDWTTNNNIIYITFDIYKGILLSHKKKEIIPYAATWMDLVIIRLSEVRSKSERERQILHDIPYMWNLKYNRNGISLGSLAHTIASWIKNWDWMTINEIICYTAKI